MNMRRTNLPLGTLNLGKELLHVIHIGWLASSQREEDNGSIIWGIGLWSILFHHMFQIKLV
jgi:hypothetical protein